MTDLGDVTRTSAEATCAITHVWDDALYATESAWDDVMPVGWLWPDIRADPLAQVGSLVYDAVTRVVSHARWGEGR